MERLLEIRDRVLAALQPLAGDEEIRWDRAAGRYLAEPARARLASPPRTCSAMDGYAVRARDVSGPCGLPVADTVYAGDPPARTLEPGQAVRIFTGGTLPEGADAVVREESVRREGSLAMFSEPARVGENVRPAGEDVEVGGVALPAGARLGARQLALLAAVGADAVRVHRRPRVAILATGDEVVSGRTPDSNGEAIAGLVRAIGGEPDRRRVGDRLAEVEGALVSALSDADVVLTIGGVSVGERDLVPAALDRLGAEVRVHGVPMKPGKPFLFALARGKPLLGLPGSPSACLASFEVFARPALLALAGSARRHRSEVRVRIAEAAAGKPGRARLLWALLEEGGRARPLGRDAAQVRGPALANALLLVPSGAGDLAEGSEVRAWILDDDAA